MKRNVFVILLGLSVIMLNGCSNTTVILKNSNAMENTIPKSTPDTDSAALQEAETDIPETVEPAESTEAAYYGTWEIKDCQTADVYALSQEEIEDFLDDTVTYRSDAVLWNGEEIDIETFGYEYEYEAYTEELLVRNYHANLGEWWNGIENISCGFVTSQESFFGDQFFLVDNNTIWIYYEGVFFLAKKI